jgi:hypothetical protein
MLQEFYRNISQYDGTEVIVDSSKLPMQADVIAVDTPIDLRVVHLVRDPRACAFSFSQQKGYPLDSTDNTPMIGSAISTLSWLATNAGAELTSTVLRDKYVRVSYEELMESPRKVVNMIAEHVGLEPQSMPFNADKEVQVRSDHVVAGNPDRHRYGSVALRADERWKTEMAKRDWALTTAISLPMLRHYRYI